MKWLQNHQNDFQNISKKIQKRNDKHTKKYLNMLLIMLFGIILLISLFSIDHPKQLWLALQAAKPRFLLLAFGCMLLYWFIESLCLYTFSHHVKEKLLLRNSFIISMVGQLFNCMTPFASGGQPIQAIYLKKCNISIGKASSILLAKFITYQLILTIYSMFLIVLRFRFFLDKIPNFSWLILLGYIVNSAIIVALLSMGFFPQLSLKIVSGVLWLLQRLRLLKNTQTFYHKSVQEIDTFFVEFKLLLKKPLVFFLPSILTVLQLTSFFSVPFFIGLSLGLPSADFLSVISASAFVLLLSSFIPFPGGSGGTEGGFYLLFSLFFSTSATVAIVLLLWRIFTFYLPMLLGFILSKIKINNDWV